MAPHAQGPVSTFIWSLTCLEPSSPAGGVPEATLIPGASAVPRHRAGCLWRDQQCRTHEVRQAPSLGA